MSQSYQFSVSSNIQSQSVDLRRLESEITSSAIKIKIDPVERVVRAGDVLTVTFLGPLDQADQDVLTALMWSHSGVPEEDPVQEVSIRGVNVTGGRIDTTFFPSTVSRKNIFTHDFTDATTWYTDSEKVVDHEPVRVESEGGRYYDVDFSAFGDGPHYIIQTTNAKVFGEDSLVAPDGGKYAPIVTVNGVVQRERHIDNRGEWDYVIDYADFKSSTGTLAKKAGRIEFRRPPAEGDAVRITYYRARSSVFYVRPAPGKKLELNTVEIQFSSDISIKDTMVFQPYGLFGGLSPGDQLKMQMYLWSIGAVPNGITPPAETIVPYGNPTVYKSMRDFIREANGNYSVIPPSQAPQDELTDRDMRYGSTTYPWNYQSVIPLYSSKGMFIEIRLIADVPYYGEFGDASFYCFSEDEPAEG